MTGEPRTRSVVRLWENLVAPGPPPPGLPVLAAALLGGTLVLIGVLVWLGVTDHGKASWHFYEHRAGTYSSGALLVATAALAFGVARRVADRRVARFWLGAALGFLYLAVDDVTAIHEDLDMWLHGLFGWPRHHPVTDHIDDAIVILYGAVALVWALRYRDALLRLRWATLLMSLALVGFAVTAALDVIGLSTALEESMKLVTEALLVLAVYAARRDAALADLPQPGVYFSGL